MAEFIVNPAEATTPIEVVCGNANAEIIRFTFDRNSDGVDLAGCAWAVTAKNSGGFSDVYMEGHGITNVSVSDTTISVDWALFGIAVGATGRTKYQLIGLQGKAIVKQFPYHTLNVLSYLESTLSTEAQEDVSALWETIEYVGNQLPEILDAEAARKVAEKGRVNAENERVAAENMRDNAEDERIVFENQRRENEDERVRLEAQRRSAEEDRVDSETERKSEEAERVAAENVRVAAENARAEAENERVAAENARKAAENARASAESKRVASENDRVSNENQRQANEAERVRLETQRRTAEADRVKSEEERKAAEAGRVSAEANRVAAENVRAQAEESRVTGFGRLNLTTVKTGKVTTVTAVNAQGKITTSEIVDGADGTGLIIKGLYASLSALKAAHPTGAAGDAYAVGTSSDNEVYVWDVNNRTWQNLGPLQGPAGPQGVPGPEGPRGLPGENGQDGQDAPQEAVLFVTQTLTANQKEQARTNIGIPNPTTYDSGKFLRVNSSGAYTLQTVTAAEGVSF